MSYLGARVLLNCSSGRSDRNGTVCRTSDIDRPVLTTSVGNNHFVCAGLPSRHYGTPNVRFFVECRDYDRYRRHVNLVGFRSAAKPQVKRSLVVAVHKMFKNHSNSSSNHKPSSLLYDHSVDNRLCKRSTSFVLSRNLHGKRA